VEIIDLIGICDIQCYKYFINNYAVLKVWDTNSSFVKNRICIVKCSWRRYPWRPKGGHAWCFACTNLPRHLSSILRNLNKVLYLVLY
jgi:hypothetical protein